MALRRGLFGLQHSLLDGLRALVMREASAAPLAAPTLVSLRGLATSGCCGGGTPPARQQAAAAAAAAPAAGREEESLEEIRARIFGTHIGGRPGWLGWRARARAHRTAAAASPTLPPLRPGNGLRSGRKALRKALVGAKIAAYYPEDPVKADPLMLSIKAEK